MSDKVPHIYFPPGVVDRNGRRMRPGVLVRTSSSSGLSEVIGWQGGKVVVMSVDEANVDSVDKETCTVVDDQETERVTTGALVVEVFDRPTRILMSAGTRDILVDGSPIQFGEVRVRSEEILNWLDSLNRAEALRWVAEHLSAPIMGRLLRECALPVDIDELVILVSNQTPPHERDTVFVGELLKWVLEAEGWTWSENGVTNESRWIDSVRLLEIKNLPHVLEAVCFQLRDAVRELFASGARVVVGSGGGTPAMNFGALITAVSVAKAAGHDMRSVRHVQIPDVDSGGLVQPPIEFDVDDLNWLAEIRDRG